MYYFQTFMWIYLEIYSSSEMVADNKENMIETFHAVTDKYQNGFFEKE